MNGSITGRSNLQRALQFFETEDPNNRKKNQSKNSIISNNNNNNRIGKETKQKQ